MMDPNNATGAADALTPTGPNEYDISDPRDFRGRPERPTGPGEYDEMPEPAERMAPDVLPEDTANVIEVQAAIDMATELPDPPEPKVITGAFVNAAVRGVRAPFDAKKKRGEAFKGARSRLDKLGNAAVLAFRDEHLPELSDDQVLKISRGEAQIVGDNMTGFGYEES